jgi:hypothetical protein
MKMRYSLTFLMAIIFVFFDPKPSRAQIQIIDSAYTTFGGLIKPCYLIVGDYVVLNIDHTAINNSQLSDTQTLQRIKNRCDSLYAYYLANLGYQPPGGNPNYGNKCNIYFGDPTCGAGCGLVGSKGIEVSGFSGIFNNIKHKINNNSDVIVGYELGRNFFTFGSKVLFPFTPGTDEKNGGWAEAFAQLFASKAFEYAISSPDERIFNETIKNLYWGRKNFIG